MGHKFSGVHGYVWNHRFYGTIILRKSVLFVEPIVSNNQIRFPYFVPSSRTVVKKKGSLNAYVYKIYSRKLRKSLQVTPYLFTIAKKLTFFLINPKVSEKEFEFGKPSKL